MYPALFRYYKAITWHALPHSRPQFAPLDTSSPPPLGDIMDERKATLDPIEDKGSSMGTEVNVLGVGNDNERDFATRIAESATHRKLGARQIQLTSIAGSIGAALFVAIGSGVPAGPLALLLGFTFWASVIYCIAQCQLEIVTKFPYDGSFIRLAGRMVDPAFGVAAGWNMFVSTAADDRSPRLTPSSSSRRRMSCSRPRSSTL